MKVLFEEILNNKTVGSVIDKWNAIYEYEFYSLPQGKFMRTDLQQPNDNEVLTLESIVKFYIEQIENKMSYELNGDWYDSLKHDLNILKTL